MFSLKNGSWLGLEPTTFVAIAHHILHLGLGGIGWVLLESNRITGFVLLFVFWCQNKQPKSKNLQLATRLWV